MGIGIVILFYLIKIFILCSVLALIGGIVVCFLCKTRRKRKVFCAVFVPYLFFYSLYFIGFIGGSTIVSEIKNVDDGIGDSFYAPLNKFYLLEAIDDPGKCYITWCGSNTVVADITKIQKIDDRVFGKGSEDYNNDEKYFSLNLKTDEIKFYSDENELINAQKLKKLDLKNSSNFYTDLRWKTAGAYFIFAGILSLILSVLICIKFCKFVLKK